MKCALCDCFIYQETSIDNLFHFQDICDQCIEKYAPHHDFEVIPIDLGTVTYHYLFKDRNINVKQREYLMKHMRILYKFCLENNDQKRTIIFIDSDFLRFSKEESLLLKGFGNIVILSLVRYDFDDYMIFS